MEKAISLLQTGAFSCVLEKDGAIMQTKIGIGIKPILELMRECPALLAGSDLADKIIGRAAATALIKAGVCRVYGEIMSVHGKSRLDEYGITNSCGMLVAQINNRDHSDMCPLEKSSFEYDEIDKSFASMMSFIESKMAQNKN